MGTGAAVTGLTDRITAAKMNAKLETVDTANITAGAVDAAALGASAVVAGKLQTSTLDATNVLKVTTGALAGGLAVSSNQLLVNLEAANPSLQIASNELGLKIYADGGLQKDTNGTSIKVQASHGLECLTAGLGLLLDTNPGLAMSATGLILKVKASSGLTLDTDGVYVAIEASKGLAAGASGLATVLQSNQGLTVAAGGLAVDYDNTTVGIVTNKLAVKAGGVANSNLACPQSYVVVNWAFNAVPINQSAVYFASYKVPAACTLVGAQVWCTATVATATVDITEGTVNSLTTSMTPVAGTLVEGSVSDAVLDSGDEVRVKITTNGSGTITNCHVSITLKFQHVA